MIKDFKLDINSYPEVKERMFKASMRYYLSLYLFKKPDDPEYMSLKKIEDLFLGIKPMLGYLAEDLLFKGRGNDAKGLFMRHDLRNFVRPDVLLKLEPIVYDPKMETPDFDKFGPLSEEDCI